MSQNVPHTIADVVKNTIFANTNLYERVLTIQWRVNGENMRILLPIHCCQFLLFALLNWHSVVVVVAVIAIVCFFHSFSYYVSIRLAMLSSSSVSSAIPFPYIHFCSVYLFFYCFSNTLFTHFLLLFHRFVHPSSF